MKSVSILGSTGSIGVNGLDVAAHLGYRIEGLAARSNRALFKEQITRFKPRRAALADAKEFEALKRDLNGQACDLLH